MTFSFVNCVIQFCFIIMCQLVLKPGKEPNRGKFFRPTAVLSVCVYIRDAAREMKMKYSIIHNANMPVEQGGVSILG